MINTCSHQNYNSSLYRTFAISGNRGKDVNYNGKCYPKLAPKLSFWKTWHDNIGIVSEEENTKYYIEQYYLEVLSQLDPEEIYNELDNSILLCYEENMEFCHRHIVAEWFQILLNVEIPEIKVVGSAIEEVKRPNYIREYLEEMIKKNKNMRGFNSLRALYLFEKSEMLEQKANILEEKTGEYCGGYRQIACFLRCDADEAEAEYRSNKKIIKKISS